MDQERLPVIPGSANFAAIGRTEGGALAAYHAPRWLTSALGQEHEFPLQESRSSPLAPLFNIARDLFDTGLPIENFLLELETPKSGTLGLLLQGKLTGDAWRIADSIPAGTVALFMLRDVTDVLHARRKAQAIGAYHGLAGQSLPMLEVFHKIAIYGPTEAPVIVTGETGSGKELIAKAIHERSERADGPFVAVNCMALSPELFESELFGHEKGAFTGAVRSHRGRFQRANGGTLFLDEIGDMPLHTQSKMLRALEDGLVERVGSEEPERVDVRIVAATNVALEQAVQARRFRADLYHRLSVLRIHVPPLRERTGDIEILANNFLEIFNERYKKEIRRITPEAMRLLKEYHWPGNVRELRNVMERLVIETQGEAISGKALNRWMDEREFLSPGSWDADSIYQGRQPIIPQAMAFPDTEPPRNGDMFWGARPSAIYPSERIIEARALPAGRAEPEERDPVELTAEGIQEAFNAAKGNLTRAARQLGVHKATLYRHMKQLGITREDLEAGEES